MGTFQADPPENHEFLAALQAENAQLQADGLAMQQQAALARIQPVPIILSQLKKVLKCGTTRDEERVGINSR